MSRAKQDTNPTPRNSRDADKPTQRASRREHRHNVDAADWGNADPQRIAAAIISVTRVGCAIQFGYTSDGGSLVVRIVGDGDKPYNEYIRPSEDIDLYLAGLSEDFESAR